MKITILASILITFACLSGQCSLSSNESNLNTNTNSTGAQSPSNSSKDKAQSPSIYEIYEQMPGEIAGLSKQAGINNLREANLPDSEKEIRIWKALGSLYPQCFILKIQKDSPSAFHVGLKVVGGRAILDKKGEPIYVQTALGSPLSGWEEVIKYLKTQGIDSSIKLSLDKTYEVYPDQNLIVMEMKTGSQYSMVFYSSSTMSQDGQKAINICQRMEHEFGKGIGCGS